MLGMWVLPIWHIFFINFVNRQLPLRSSWWDRVICPTLPISSLRPASRSIVPRYWSLIIHQVVRTTPNPTGVSDGHKTTGVPGWDDDFDQSICTAWYFKRIKSLVVGTSSTVWVWVTQTSKESGEYGTERQLVLSIVLRVSGRAARVTVFLVVGGLIRFIILWFRRGIEMEKRREFVSRNSNWFLLWDCTCRNRWLVSKAKLTFCSMIQPRFGGAADRWLPKT